MKKKSEIPDFKHAPPPPELKAKRASTPEELAIEILGVMSKLNVPDQNKVMEALNMKYAALRYDEYENARLSERETGANFEKYLATTREIEEFIKARHAAKELSK